MDERLIFVGVGDFNEDSRSDLAVANYHVNTTDLLLDYGNCSFRIQNFFSTNRNPRNIALLLLNIMIILSEYFSLMVM